MRRRLIHGSILIVGFALLLALGASAQERGKVQLSIGSASYSNGVLTIVVKNEGEEGGGGTVKVHRERMRCLEVDTEYCKENPYEGCVNPCKKYETKDLGEETAKVPTVAPYKEATVEVKIPDEEAYAEITVEPGSRLGFGIEIKPKA